MSRASAPGRLPERAPVSCVHSGGGSGGGTPGAVRPLHADLPARAGTRRLIAAAEREDPRVG